MTEQISYNYNEKDRLAVTLADGRIISVPLAWYPRLAAATPEQRNNYYLSYFGVHWEDIDEAVSVDGLMKGNKSPEAPLSTDIIK